MAPRIAALLGVLLLVVPVAVWYAGRGPTAVGDLPEPGSTTPSTAAPADSPPPPPAAVAPPTAVASRSGLLRRAPDTEVDAPRRLRIPALGLDVPIVAVGVEHDGALQIPEDVGEVGWYRHGPVPGDAGSAVLAGHVDSRTQGRGAFFELRRLQPGDRIEVDGAVGTTDFEVVARRRYGKDVIPLAEVFERAGAPRLALITCGGEFDAATGHYRDNIVVYAVPVAPGASAPAP